MQNPERQPDQTQEQLLEQAPDQSGPAAEKWSFPDAIPARSDSVSAAIVRKSITLQQIHGTAHAVAFLREKGIDVDIAMRVLLNMPAYRRRDDLVDHLAVQAAVGGSLA